MKETNVAEVVRKEERHEVKIPSLAKQLHLGVESAYLNIPHDYEISQYNHCGLRIPRSTRFHFDEKDFRLPWHYKILRYLHF